VSWFGKQQEKHKMERVYRMRPTYRYSPKGVWIDDKGVYHRAYPYSTNHDNNKKFFHRLANRTVRRRLGDEELVKRGGYKKIFDLWWSVY